MPLNKTSLKINCCYLACFALIFLSIVDIKLAFSNDIHHGLSQNKLIKIKDIVRDYQNKTTEELFKEVKKVKNIGLQNISAIKKIILLKKYSDSKFDYKNKNIRHIKSILSFIEQNSFFPKKSDIIRNIENIIIHNDIPFSQYHDIFFQNILRNETSVKFQIYDFYARLDFLQNDKNDDIKTTFSNQIEDLAKEIWQNVNLTQKDENKFFRVNSHFLYQSDHISKISNLIWQNKHNKAQNMSKLVRTDYKNLFQTVINIKTSKKELNLRKIITKLDERFRGLEIVYYSLAKYYHKKGNEDKVIEILSLIPSHAKKSEKWWEMKNLYGRELLKKKKYHKSYQVMASHGLKKGTYDYAAAEWLLGWISLRFLKSPEIAREHFTNMYDNVGYPLSLSRGAYWIGMTYTNNIPQQNYWYQKAAEFPMYFYGQLAINKLNNENRIFGSQNYYQIAKEKYNYKIDRQIKRKIFYSDIARILYIAQKINQDTIFKKTLKKFIADQEESEILALLDILYPNSNVDYKISKLLERKKIFLINDSFKNIKLLKNYQNKNLVQSIMKQESGFDQGAVSSAGAIGLMQVMPNTAKKVARDLKIRYRLSKLKNDKKYNIKIGSAYLTYLLKKFNNSKILTIASYNAGPNSTLRWIKEQGDVRKLKNLDDIVDWIESITYHETRNYVQRIIENINIYNSRGKS